MLEQFPIGVRVIENSLGLKSLDRLRKVVQLFGGSEVNEQIGEVIYLKILFGTPCNVIQGVTYTRVSTYYFTSMHIGNFI